PLVRLEVLRAIVTGTQVGRNVHNRTGLVETFSQVTFAEAVSVSEPSPIFAASTVCGAPFCPTGIVLGPILAVEIRNFCAANTGTTRASKHVQRRQNFMMIILRYTNSQYGRGSKNEPGRGSLAGH